MEISETTFLYFSPILDGKQIICLVQLPNLLILHLVKFMFAKLYQIEPNCQI